MWLDCDEEKKKNRTLFHWILFCSSCVANFSVFLAAATWQTKLRQAGEDKTCNKTVMWDIIDMLTADGLQMINGNVAALRSSGLNFILLSGHGAVLMLRWGSGAKTI